MTFPSFAAVILNYNYAAFVADAVESILKQRKSFDEIIVVNDGSTDNSLEVLKPYANRARVLDIPNGGQFGACVAGMRAATSDYLYFLDADDCAMPHLLQRLTSVVVGQPVKVQFQLEGVNVEREPLRSWFPTFPAGYDAARMRSDNGVMGFYICPPTSGNLYHRETLMKLPIEKMDHRDFIDGPATLVLPYKGEIVSVMEPLAQYRVHGKNHSHRAFTTPMALQGEIDWFYRRWSEACTILEVDRAPFGKPPLYVLERELMMRALESRPAVGNAIRVSGRVWQTAMSLQHKILLTFWALALSLPLRSLQTALVASRRSSANRPRALAWLVARVGRFW